ncbi:MAG TPA: hypothetical protein VLB76_13130 [Thermoanaerobaculia bacterium]|jgi:hypothetical protein|nr:hypothetical protein [Thermoanaerobaculia bacterium]
MDFDKREELTMARVRQVINDRAERAKESMETYLNLEQTSVLEGAFRSFLVDFLHLVEKTTGSPMPPETLKALVDDAVSMYTLEKQGPFRVIIKERHPG